MTLYVMFTLVLSLSLKKKGFRPVGLCFRPVGLHFRPQGLRFRPVGLRFRPVGLRFRPCQGLRFRAVGIRFRLQGLRFRPQGLRSSVFVFGSSFSTHPQIPTESVVETYREYLMFVRN